MADTPATPDLEQELLDAATAPHKIQTTSGIVQQQDLLQLMQIANRQASIAARSKGAFGGLKCGKFIPPGTTSDHANT